MEEFADKIQDAPRDHPAPRRGPGGPPDVEESVRRERAAVRSEVRFMELTSGRVYPLESGLLEEARERLDLLGGYPWKVATATSVWDEHGRRRDATAVVGAYPSRGEYWAYLLLEGDGETRSMTTSAYRSDGDWREEGQDGENED